MNDAIQPNGRGAAQDGGPCVLVTGAARGIGAAIARALADDGFAIGVNYSSDAAGARAVAGQITASGGRAMAVRADVADRAAVESMFDDLRGEFGSVAVLVNNAGTRHDRLAAGLDPSDWHRVLDVNLSGAFNTIQCALGDMVRSRWGRIVNVTTISASRPLPGQAAYAASKAGVEALTRTVAIEVARRGVTVNAIAPGLVATSFVPEMTEEWAGVVPVRRSAEPREIAAVTRFLASQEAAYVTGAVIPVDGALTAGLGLFGRPRQVGARSSAPST